MFYHKSFVKLTLDLNVTLSPLSNIISTIPSHNIQSAGIAPCSNVQSNNFLAPGGVSLYARAPSYQLPGAIGFAFLKPSQKNNYFY